MHVNLVIHVYFLQTVWWRNTSVLQETAWFHWWPWTADATKRGPNQPGGNIKGAKELNAVSDGLQCHRREVTTRYVIPALMPKSWIAEYWHCQLLPEKWTYCTRNRRRGLLHLPGHLNSNRRYLKMEKINKCVAFV